MPSFQEMFEKTKGQPIVYQGQTLVMVDLFPMEATNKFRLVFELCNSQWRQGISLRIRDKGDILMNGEHGKHAVCWEHTAPQIVDFEATARTSAIEVKNVWDVGNGVMESWHNGAAMIVEQLPNGRRYRCNDGFPDDDFDDIVFRIERLGCDTPPETVVPL